MDTLGQPQPPHFSTAHIREGPNNSCSLVQYQMSGSSAEARNTMTCSHNGNKPYSCPFCSFRASHRSKIQSHSRTHTGEKPHTCPFCPSRFAKKGNLKTHIRTHTGEKPYACPHCQYSCAHKSDLKKHIIVHYRHTMVS